MRNHLMGVDKAVADKYGLNDMDSRKRIKARRFTLFLVTGRQPARSVLRRSLLARASVKGRRAVPEDTVGPRRRLGLRSWAF